MSYTRKQALTILRNPLDLDALPTNEARIAIAKDVIAGLKIQRLRAASDGFYLKFKPLGGEPRIPNHLDNDPMHPRLPEAVCEVCALGALYVADVARRNADEGPRTNVHKMRDRLSKFFAVEQMVAIECAFEMSDTPINHHGTTLYPKANDFGKRNKDDAEARMISIMQNIIDNDGYFLP